MSTLKHRTSAAPEADMATPRTLVERAYLGLRHDVVCGKLAPGERLRVEHLKDQYQVGSGTLREALSLLVSGRTGHFGRPARVPGWHRSR